MQKVSSSRPTGGCFWFWGIVKDFIKSWHSYISYKQNWGWAQILILAWYLDKEKQIKAHLTIYTREYLLILIICFLSVCLFCFWFYILWLG